MDLFEQIWLNSFNTSSTSLGATNIIETDEKYTIEMLYPGRDKNNMRMTLENDILTVKYEHKAEKVDGKYNKKGFYITSFERSFKVDKGTTEIYSSYEDGILYIDVYKPQIKSSSIKIEVK